MKEPLLPNCKLFWSLVDLERRLCKLKYVNGEGIVPMRRRRLYLLGFEWGWKESLSYVSSQNNS